MSTSIRKEKGSKGHLSGTGQESCFIGVALFLFRATFSFSPSLHQRAKPQKNFSLACVHTRASTNQYIYFFLFFFYFFFIKRKVSEEMPFNSELWVRNSNNFRKNVLFFGSNSNNFGRNKDKWVRNFGRKLAKNTLKSASFHTPKIMVFSLVAQ